MTLFRRMAIIGVGLIGSSIALAARKNGLVDEIYLVDRKPEHRAKAKELKLGDEVFDDPESAIEFADLVILAVPVGQIGKVVEKIAPLLKAGTILTDVGSVKVAVDKAVRGHLPKDVVWIPGHPIAGTEHSGPEAGFAELFEGRWHILTPREEVSMEDTEKLAAFWRGMGSDVDVMSPERHDRTMAITSHLPHLIAYTIVGTVAELEEETQSEVLKFSASGFRDFTRIAASDPIMWRDIFLNNKDAVLEMLGRYSEDLVALQKAVRRGDGELLEKWFTRTRKIRRDLVQTGQAAGPGYFQPLPPKN